MMPPLLSPRTPHQPQTRGTGRSPSPNYFGLTVDSTTSTVKPTGPATSQTPWTPSGSQVLAHAGASPQKIIANNPDYEAFLTRRNSDQNRINIRSNGSIPPMPPPSPPMVPSMKAISRKASTSSSTTPPNPPASLPTNKAETVCNDGPVHLSRSPKRLLSSDTGQFLDGPRRQSPADFNDKASAGNLGSPGQKQEEKPMRLSLPPKGTPPVAKGIDHHRSTTISEPPEPNAPTLITAQHAVDLLKSKGDKALLLDLRVSTQYAESHLKDALNLCIPTTLLKRPSYNVSRLADTFKDEGQKAKFGSWQSCTMLIVYDNNSSQLKEASNCVNILKKFSSEGWKGQCFIIRGGFMETGRKCPDYIDESGPRGPRDASANLAIRSQNTSLPPVVGGCPMPVTKSAANPFFGNIRQNTDLIGGVGQLPVHCPPTLNKGDFEELPQWLRKAADERDQGKTVSDKFLKIEKREQKRMQQALSGTSTVESPTVGPVGKVEIAGIEKGTKNRYNNIFPYEHSRVRLKGVPRDACDYVNANFIRTSMSHKKYIATQGPIPATFGDFWNMVWQRDVRVLVMLTAESEGGQVKAHNYWNEKRYGPVKVNFHSEKRVSLEGTKVKSPIDKINAQRRSSHMDLVKRTDNPPSSNTADSEKEEPPTVIVRKFTISHDNYPFERMREVTHMQYGNWPDFGAPAHPLHLLRLVEQCDGVVRATGSGPSDGPEPPNDRPVLVHCSAGCGRTGTFCTVDTVLDVLKRQRRHCDKPREPTPMDIDSSQNSNGSSDVRMASPVAPKSPEVNGDWLNKQDIDFVEKVVEEFRLQRLSMVQSLRQFVLCYETVLEWIAQLGVPKTA